VKNLRKIFLTSILLFSSASFLSGAMKQKPIDVQNPSKNHLSSVPIYQISQKLRQKTPFAFRTFEQSWKNWVEKKAIDLSLYKFKDAEEFKTTFLILKPIWDQIQELNLSFCNISQLPEEFKNLQLSKLTLSLNTLNESSFDIISQIPSLEVLCLPNCGISTLNPNLTKLTNLKSLNLSKNKLNAESVDTITQIKALETLNLHECGIENVDKQNKIKAALPKTKIEF
jgi:Leucine-rich repeat (LRR) protein